VLPAGTTPDRRCRRARRQPLRVTSPLARDPWRALPTCRKRPPRGEQGAGRRAIGGRSCARQRPLRPLVEPLPGSRTPGNAIPCVLCRALRLPGPWIVALHDSQAIAEGVPQSEIDAVLLLGRLLSDLHTLGLQLLGERLGVFGHEA